MFTESQTRRIAQHATIALVKVIDKFPGLIDNTEADDAAAIIADMLKAGLTRPAPEPDPTAGLRGIIDAIQAATAAPDGQ